MERGTVTAHVADVCKGRQIRVAWNWMGILNMKEKDNKFIQYNYADVTHLYANHITFPHEILSSFLTEHHLSPTFRWARQDWGTWHPETKKWSGAGMVRKDINFVLVLRVLRVLPTS